MTLRTRLSRLGRYGVVGCIAAAVHFGILRGLSGFTPEWLANPVAFLIASVTGYLGHALLTFREETGRQRFARRWLLLQYGVNLSVCGLLPLLLPGNAADAWRNLILVFTPTVLNALIWSRAARFSVQQRQHTTAPQIHADDLGLSAGVDAAITELALQGRLNGASLLVEGPTATSAVASWRALPTPLPLCLHLCLTEGPATKDCPDLPSSFGQLLLASLLPSRQRQLRPQLLRRIRSQIKRYKELTGLQTIRLDGHQHIHLVPIVMACLLEQPEIDWIRTTAEPLPSGLPLEAWASTIRDGGLLKWMVLQLLTALAKPKLKQRGIATNPRFAGVLFTGRMVGAPLLAAERCLDRTDLLLAHPAQSGSHHGLAEQGFDRSEAFFNSPWRQREWNALSTRARPE